MYPFDLSIFLYDLIKHMNTAFANALGNCSTLIFVYAALKLFKTMKDPTNNPPDRDMLMKLCILMLALNLSEFAFTIVNMLI